MKQTQDLNQAMLFDAICAVKNTEECRAFLYDLCTPAEIEEFAARWHIARLLTEGKPYRTISEETGVSTTTVGRVARFMKYGNGGYTAILKRLGFIKD